MNRRAVAAFMICAMGGLAAYVEIHWQVETSMTHFLPEQGRVDAKISSHLADSNVAKTLILTLRGPDLAATLDASRRVESALKGCSETAWVMGGADNALFSDARSLYFPRRYLMIAATPEERDRRLSDAGLHEAVRSLKSALGSPIGALVRQGAAEDPMVLFPALLERLHAGTGAQVQIQQGRFVTHSIEDPSETRLSVPQKLGSGRADPRLREDDDDGPYAVLFVASRQSAFDGGAQKRLQECVADAKRTSEAAMGSTIELEQAGAGRFSNAAEHAIRSDATRITALSVVLMVSLFLIMFRSLALFVVGALPIACGILSATAVSLFLWGKIHGLTLAFGATLVGVCIDYPVHFFNHLRFASPSEGPRDVLRSIRPGLLLGGVTTIMGMAGLAWTSFPGIREIAVFASVGTSVALLVTLLVIPHLLPRSIVRHKTASAGAAHKFDIRQIPRSALVTLLCAALAIIAIGVPKLRWNDRLAALSQLDPALLAEDARVRSRVSATHSGQVIVALGNDAEMALRTNEQVFQTMQDAQRAAEIRGFTSIHPLLWSQSLQHSNFESMRGAQLADRMPAILTSNGFALKAFAPFFASLKEIPEPLTYAELAQSSMAPLVQHFVFDAGSEKGFLTFLQSVSNPDALRSRLQAIPNATYFDHTEFLTRVYSDLRLRTIELIGAGLVGVFLLLLARYRNLQLTLAAFCPPIVACATATSLLTLMGVELNLLHVMSGLLVLSMGVDYGIFLVEMRDRADAQIPTLLSLVAACLSTVFSFGVLALSDTPPLRAMGQMTGLGVLLCLILAPTAWLILARKEKP